MSDVLASPAKKELEKKDDNKYSTNLHIASSYLLGPMFVVPTSPVKEKTRLNTLFIKIY
jgi:hypothetical protein